MFWAARSSEDHEKRNKGSTLTTRNKTPFSIVTDVWPHTSIIFEQRREYVYHLAALYVMQVLNFEILIQKCCKE